TYSRDFTTPPLHTTHPALSSLPLPTTTSLYTLSLHDALPIYIVAKIAKIPPRSVSASDKVQIKNLEGDLKAVVFEVLDLHLVGRSEEHTSELQSPYDLVCRLLLEKKKKTGQLQWMYVLGLYRL